MITLLASIAGFISSIIPEILKFFKDKNDKNHELNILNLQIKQLKKSALAELPEIDASYELLQQASLYTTYKTGINWIDALNGSVRPVLAYSFFIMYGIVKFMQYKAILGIAPVIVYIETIWTTDDQAIFAGIISFYFGQRTFRKVLRNK
jgi:hypothetical protein